LWMWVGGSLVGELLDTVLAAHAHMLAIAGISRVACMGETS
jgi:hypothetical protein